MAKNPPANAGDASLTPVLGRSSREGNGNPLQYFCLGNPMDRGDWQATVHGVAKELNTTKQLNNNKKLNIMKNIYELFLFLSTSIFREVPINFAYSVKN